jgi:hypothetical protein
MGKISMRAVAIIAAVCGWTAYMASPPCLGADGGADSCTGHFTKEGSFLTGRTYSTWLLAPSTTKDDAFSRVSVAIAKDGWSITSSDKATGIISAATSVTVGKGSTAPLTVVVEGSGAGSKLTATFHTAGGQAASEDTTRSKLCTYLSAASTG